MEIIRQPVTFLVRDKKDNQLLACTDAELLPLREGLMGLYELDEARREIRIKYEDGRDDHPAYRWLNKGEVAKVRDSKETRALVAELNQKIIWSQVGAVSSALDQISVLAYDLLPYTADWRREVDAKAVESGSAELKALYKACQLCEVAMALLNKAQDTDRHILARFALCAPFGADEWAAYNQAQGRK